MITNFGRKVIACNFLYSANTLTNQRYEFTKIIFGNGNSANVSSTNSLASEITDFTFPISKEEGSLVRLELEDNDTTLCVVIDGFAPIKSANVSELGLYCRNTSTGDEGLFARFVFDPIPVSSTSSVSLTFKLHL